MLAPATPIPNIRKKGNSNRETHGGYLLQVEIRHHFFRPLSLSSIQIVAGFADAHINIIILHTKLSEFFILLVPWEGVAASLTKLSFFFFFFTIPVERRCASIQNFQLLFPFHYSNTNYVCERPPLFVHIRYPCHHHLVSLIYRSPKSLFLWPLCGKRSPDIARVEIIFHFSSFSLKRKQTRHSYFMAFTIASKTFLSSSFQYQPQPCPELI